MLDPGQPGRAREGGDQRKLSGAIHIGARPLTPSEWRGLLETEGFDVGAEFLAPMHLLEPGRLVRDEGLAGALRFTLNVLTDTEARKRVLAMQKVFRRYHEHLSAIALLGVKSRG